MLVDASNAFNSLNCLVALHNIRQLCPPLSTILINIFRSPASLLVSGEVILSEEGTTQGDPLAMPMYALATVPLINQWTRSGMLMMLVLVAVYRTCSSGGTSSVLRDLLLAIL